MNTLLLDIYTASQRLGIPEGTVRRCVKEGHIEAAEIGHRCWIPAGELDSFVDRMVQRSKANRAAAKAAAAKAALPN